MAILVFSCPEKPCEDCLPDDVIIADYNPTPFNFNFPDWLIEFDIPADNPMTQEGIALGRQLFYDPILSSSQTMSCNSCHQLENSFTGGKAFNIGDSGMEGTRSSMALINLGFSDNGFNWDGKASTLEEQAINAVKDPLMLNANWSLVISRLKADVNYPVLFREAFGIERKNEMTQALAAKAIAQFERTLVSFNSRYDKVVWNNEGWFLNEEERGKSLFFKEDSQIEEHPGCSHCHIAKYLTDNTFKNNGIDNPGNLSDFSDLGRGGVTGNLYDNGKFKVPTLRNIEMTAPYMHDGRFATLEEVLDHYSEGGHGAENEDINIRPFILTEMQKQDMISFLKTLTDTTFLHNPALESPF
jgi:cytochrome c peroxidase